MKYSIIIPARNANKSLDHVLLAISNSKEIYKSEIILVDDNSVDNTVEIAKKYPHVLIHKINFHMGAGYCRNFGAKKSKGEILVFIDSDVVPDANFLEIISDEIASGSDGVGGDYYYRNTQTYEKMISSFETKFWQNYYPRAEMKFVYGGLCAFKREAWFCSERDFGENKYFSQMASGEDAYACEQISNKHKIIFRADLKGLHLTNLADRFLKRNIQNSYSRLKNIFINGFNKNSYVILEGVGVLSTLFLIFSLILIFILPNLITKSLGLFSVIYFIFTKFKKIETQDYLLMSRVLFIQILGWSIGVMKFCIELLSKPIKNKFLFIKSSILFLTSSKTNRLIFFVTKKCNFNCSWCLDKFREESNSIEAELSFEQIKKITENSKNNILYLIITGGEPFIRNDLDRIAEVFYRNLSTVFITIVSNGSFPEKIEEQLERILITCPNLRVNIQLTVSQMPAQHDQIREFRNSFELILDSSMRIKKLKKIYPQLMFTISTQTDEKNSNSLIEIVNYVKLILSPDDHIISPVRSVPMLITPANESLDYFTKAQEIIERLYNQNKGLFQIFYNQVIRDSLEEIKSIRNGSAKYYKCVAGKKFVTLYENGNLLVCENRQDLIMGNVSNNNFSLDNIISSENAKAAFNQQLSEKCKCDWGCAVTHNLMGSPVFLIKSGLASLIRKKKSFN
jgi:MoaA/NifB/PqqE/SkfB family radical SAM enzyme/GT2 family glycosyltransferase